MIEMLAFVLSVSLSPESVFDSHRADIDDRNVRIEVEREEVPRPPQTQDSGAGGAEDHERQNVRTEISGSPSEAAPEDTSFEVDARPNAELEEPGDYEPPAPAAPELGESEPGAQDSEVPEVETGFDFAGTVFGESAGSALFRGLDGGGAPVSVPAPAGTPVTEENVAAYVRDAVQVSEGFAELGMEPASVEFEPDLLGFGYVDRHTNIYAEVDQQTVTQEVLGEQVEIRATPTEFHWDYGDGATAATSESGGPLPEVGPGGEPVNLTDTETVTSHVYTETGRFPVTVTTEFVAEFRLEGEDWTEIEGTAVLESSPGEADIWRASSRHVSGECEHQDQWGCDGPVELEDGDELPEIFRNDRQPPHTEP